MEIGAITAKITADISGYNAGIESAKKKTQELGDSGKRAASDVGSIGSAGDKISQLTAVLDNTNAKIEQQRNKLGQLKESYETTFNPARKSKLQEQIVSTESTLLRLQQTSDKTAQKIWELEDALNDASSGAEKSQRSFDGLGTALTAIGANIALDKTTDLMQALVQESENLTQSLTGLSSVAKSFGHDIDATTESAKRLEKTGLVPLSSAAAALKNLLGAGLSLDQANEMMDTFLDRASFGKSATISMGQAVENLSQAFKTESSTLGDLSGISENYSLILEKGAAQLGKTVAQLNEAERAQAKYLGILQVSQPYIGDHIKLMESYGGKQAQMNAKWTELRATLGDQLLPIFDELITKLTPIIENTIKWVSENGELVAGIAAGATSFLAMVAAITTVTAVVGVLRTAFIGLNASLGPIGLITAGIAILVPTVMAASGAVKAMTSDTMEQVESQREHIAELDRLIERFDELNGKPEKTTEEMVELRDVQNELVRINPTLAKGYDELGNAMIGTSEKAKELSESMKDVMRAQAYSSYVDAIAKVKDEEEKLSKLREDMYKRERDMDETSEAFKKSLSYYIQRMRQDEEEAYKSTQEHLAKMLKGSADKVAEQDKYVAKLNESINAWRILNKEIGVYTSVADFKQLEYGEVRSTVRTEPTNSTVKSLSTSSTSAKKAKTPEEIAAELYRAEMKLLDYRRNMDQLTEQQEVDALESMLKRYGKYADLRMDAEVRIHRLSRQISEEATKESFDFSSQWIVNEEGRMRTSNASEQEIAQMKIEAWTRVRNRHAEDTEYYKRADKEIYDNKRQLIDKATTMQIAALQKEREMKRDVLRDTQKAEQDAHRKSIDEQKEAFDTYIQSVKDRIESVKSRYDAITESLRNQINVIDEEIRKQTELDRIEDRRMKRAELADKRAKIIADKRYEKIVVGADGKLTTELTHDTEAVAEIDRQLAQMDREDAIDAKRRELEERKRQLQDEIIAVNKKRDAEISALNDEIAAIQRAKEIKIATMNQELDAMRANHDQKLKAFDTYWTSVLDKDQIAQDMRNQVLQDGLDTTLSKVTTHLEAVMGTYRQKINEMLMWGAMINGSVAPIIPQSVNNTSSTTNNRNTNIGNVNVSSNNINELLDSVYKLEQAARNR